MAEKDIEKRRKALGRKVLEKYRDEFGPDWVETREGADGGVEVRLKPLAEYRGRFEKPGEFLLIEGEEVTAGKGQPPVHLNAINLTEAITPTPDLTTVREVLRANLQRVAEAREAGGKPVMAHVNHPNFRWTITAEDLAQALDARFFEVHNGHPGTFTEGDAKRAESATGRIWDIANTLRIAEFKAAPIYGVGTDDSHNYHGGDVSPGKSWVMVRAAELTPEALIRAMEAGDFYASSGVTLREVSFDEATGRLRLEIDAKPGVSYTTRFFGTRRGYDRAVTEVAPPEGDFATTRLRYSDEVGAELGRSDSLTPEYVLTGDELFVRAVVTADEAPENPSWQGQRAQAWTQPVGWKKALPGN